MAPFLFRAVELLARVERDLRFVLCLSPFIGTASLDSIFSHSRHRGQDRRFKRHSSEERWPPLEAVTAEGVNVRIETLHRYEAMVAADIAICTPGPVCSELAYLGTPPTWQRPPSQCAECCSSSRSVSIPVGDTPPCR